MTLAFILSMPGVASWNGQWSGHRKNYVVARGVRKSQQGLAGQYFSYDFGDGWRAGVKVETISPNQARHIRRHSDGFCGYDWMVDSILSDGKIIAPHQRKAAA